MVQLRAPVLAREWLDEAIENPKDANLAKLQRAFELGEIDVLELAQIQQRILVTQQDALAALDDYYRSLAVLEALSGVDTLSTQPSKP